MNRNKVLSKGTVLAIIVLFVGISIIPLTVSVEAKKYYLSDSELTFSSFNPDGNTLYVGGVGPENYTSIQDAIDNASDGDTVFVYNGIYYENVVIYKRINLQGENRNTTVINGCGTGHVVKTTTDYVNISRFTVKDGHIGIKIKSNYNNIRNNKISNNYDGVWIEHVDNSTISNNEFSSNIYYAVISWYDIGTTIINNTIADNGFGILSVGSYLGNIISNDILNHSLAGMDLVFSSNNLITCNNIFSNKIGIWLGESTNNLVVYNNISNNNVGVRLSCSLYNNDIQYNNIYYNKKAGIALYTYSSNSINNWWGHPSGPYHPITNRRGKGDNISCSLGYVFYRPYLKSPVDITRARSGLKTFTDSTKTNSSLDSIMSTIFKILRKTTVNELFSDIYGKAREKANGLYEQSFIKNNEQYDMVIIAPTRFTLPLRRLVAHKNNVGVKTKLITLPAIYLSYRGHDGPEKIKHFIKDAMENWDIKYVMLVGSIDKLPIRKTWPVGNKPIITDLYYADIYDEADNFSSWDSNNNGFYGEFNHNGETDKVDLVPDVGVGRLACRNLREVYTVVDKIINYEGETYEKEWFKRLVLCGGDTFPNYGDINEGEFLCEKIAENMDNFIPIRLWLSNRKLSSQNITNEINKGAGFVLFAGHGSSLAWLTHSSEAGVKSVGYSILNFPNLVNCYRLPIIYVDACLTAKLDSVLPCFAWSSVAKRGGGAIAAIGSVRPNIIIIEKNGFMRGANHLTFLFFSSYKNNTTLSDMLMEAQTEHIKRVGRDYITLEEFILLGDPSLKVGGYP